MPRDTPVRIRAFSRARLPRVARSTLAEGGECTLLRTARTWEAPCPPGEHGSRWMGGWMGGVEDGCGRIGCDQLSRAGLMR